MGNGADRLIPRQRAWVRQSVRRLDRAHRMGSSALSLVDLHHLPAIRGVLESRSNRSAPIQQRMFRADVYPHLSNCAADFFRESRSLVCMGMGIVAERDFLVHSLDMG